MEQNRDERNEHKAECVHIKKNTDTPMVSVIVPIYNVEQYLTECLTSVCRLEFKSIEIICVVDGATDNSLQIAEEFALKDDRIMVIRQENSGISAARNTGMRYAAGRYIWFVDSDDMVTNTLEQFIRRMEADDLDVLFFGADTFSDEDCKAIMEKFRYQRDGIYDPVMSGANALRMLQDNHEYHSNAYLQILRRSFLDENSLAFYEGIYYEDELFTFEVLQHAQRAAVINTTGYLRRVRKGSIMTSELGHRNAVSRIICYYAAVDSLERYGTAGGDIDPYIRMCLRLLRMAIKDYRAVGPEQEMALQHLPMKQRIMWENLWTETDKSYQKTAKLKKELKKERDLNQTLKKRAVPKGRFGKIMLKITRGWYCFKKNGPGYIVRKIIGK